MCVGGVDRGSAQGAGAPYSMGTYSTHYQLATILTEMANYSV